MTFIQPNKSRGTFVLAIGALIAVLLLGTFWLVVLYNHVVNLNHAIATDKAKLDVIGAQNTMLSNEAQAALGSGQLTSLASEDGLVIENKPQYFVESAAASAVAVK